MRKFHKSGNYEQEGFNQVYISMKPRKYSFYIMISQFNWLKITRIISFLLKIIVAVAEEHDLDFYALYTR